VRPLISVHLMQPNLLITHWPWLLILRLLTTFLIQDMQTVCNLVLMMMITHLVNGQQLVYHLGWNSLMFNLLHMFQEGIELSTHVLIFLNTLDQHYHLTKVYLVLLNVVLMNPSKCIHKCLHIISVLNQMYQFQCYFIRLNNVSFVYLLLQPMNTPFDC